MADEIVVEIEKRFPGGPVIRANFRLGLDAGAAAVLFGPSGSGKTTVLRSIAGLERPERGFISFREDVWLDTSRQLYQPPESRRAGLLFQDYALFPHLTVRQNVEYGLERRSRAERRSIAEQMLAMFEIADLADRRPAQISGGQAQRVALARAVAPQPKILLLDEPLAALDLATRVRVRRELRGLLRKVGIPSLVVTHDRNEAISLGEQVIVMVGGEVRQVGPIDQVFRHPADATIADTLGVETIVQGVVVATADGLATVQVEGNELSALLREDFQPGDRAMVCIRAEEVILQRGEVGLQSARNHLAGTVESMESDGALERVTIDCGFKLTAVITRRGREEMALGSGVRVTASVKAPAVHLVKL